MKLPRFRIRTLMIAVALTALVTWVGIAVPRLSKASRFHRAMAIRFSQSESRERRFATRFQRDLDREVSKRAAVLRDGGFVDVVPTVDEMILRHDVERKQSLAEHYLTLKQRHQRAARYPWLSVEPDPPVPE